MGYHFIPIELVKSRETVNANLAGTQEPSSLLMERQTGSHSGERVAAVSEIKYIISQICHINPTPDYKCSAKLYTPIRRQILGYLPQPCFGSGNKRQSGCPALKSDQIKSHRFPPWKIMQQLKAMDWMFTQLHGRSYCSEK